MNLDPRGSDSELCVYDMHKDLQSSCKDSSIVTKLRSEAMGSPNNIPQLVFSTLFPYPVDKSVKKCWAENISLTHPRFYLEEAGHFTSILHSTLRIGVKG